MDLGWGELPSELLLMIMSYLNAKELARIANVNYHWRRVSEDNSLWRPLFIRDYEVSEKARLKSRSCWVDEYKMLKFESPIVLCENLRDCPLGLVHVSFSPNGRFFCTTAIDASFKVWTATTPTYLVHERYLQESLGWRQALSSQFSPDSSRLLVCGSKSDERGEVAVFSVNGDECEVHSVCRAPNNPSDFTCCWYDNMHILTGDVYFFNRNSVIGSSATQIFLCSAVSPWNHINEAFLCPILRLLNRQGGLCRSIVLGRYIPPRLRGVVLLAEEARVENKTLTVKAKELAQSVREGASDEEIRNELRKRLEELSTSAECSCTACMSNHEGQSTVEKCFLCCCSCHRDDDRLLIHAYGETESSPPRAIAFKIICGETVSRVSRQRCNTSQASEVNRDQESRRGIDNVEDQLSSILSLFDLPDYVIDMQACIMGLTLSLNHRFLFVNMSHGRFDANRDFTYVAEIRCINLESLSFEGSYFGHFARFSDRFQCSLGGHFLASPSLGEVRIWSKGHNCLVGKLSHANGAVAIEPINGEMVVSVGRTDGRIKIWRSKKYLQKVSVPNDFM